MPEAFRPVVILVPRGLGTGSAVWLSRQSMAIITSNIKLGIFHLVEEKEKIKHCPICGCTEHRMIGCGKHWAKHKIGPDGRCTHR